MTRLQKIIIIVIFCGLGIITIPLIRGYQINRAEERVGVEAEVREVVVTPEQEKRRPDPKVWEGFRGLKWGVDEQDIEPFRPPEGPYCRQEESSDGRVKIYAKLGDGPSIGNAVVEVFYVFYKGKFSGVFVTCEGEANFLALLEACSIHYGSPQKQETEPGKICYGWPRDTTNGDVFAIVIYDEYSETTTFTLGYGPLNDEREKDDREAALSGRDF